MAFSNAQKVLVRRYLCFSLGHYQYNTQFESMFDKIGGVAEEQAAVESVLAELATVSAAVASGGSTSSGAFGMLKKVDEVEFYDRTSQNSSAFVTPVTYGRILCRRLADIFGVELGGDYFSARRSADVELRYG